MKRVSIKSSGFEIQLRNWSFHFIIPNITRFYYKECNLYSLYVVNLFVKLGRVLYSRAYRLIFLKLVFRIFVLKYMTNYKMYLKKKGILLRDFCTL